MQQVQEPLQQTCTQCDLVLGDRRYMPGGTCWESLMVSVAFYPNDIWRSQIPFNLNMPTPGKIGRGDPLLLRSFAPGRDASELRPPNDRRFLAGGRRSRYGAEILT